VERPLNPGDVVVVPFPFSDLTSQKVRPALVLRPVQKQDVITVQISSRPYADPNAVPLAAESFAVGGLPVASYVQTAKLFTLNASLVKRTAGTVRPDLLQAVADRVVALIRGGSSS